jgi:7,8-dihydropterin-6-yl-methyl-4-(beta-D-ribofuranosyl)aminobenzene 5'-phosphate synthase
MFFKTSDISEGMGMEMDGTGLTLTTLYDNYQHGPGLRTGWGFSCLVRAGGKNILFDTGADSETLLGNMGRLGIDPMDINLVVLSHVHGDHTGGLGGILEANPDVTVHALKSFPDGFKDGIKSRGAGLAEVSCPMEIAGGVRTTGELGTSIREQSLVINTERGLVILTGCAHPGIVEIVRNARETVNRNVHLVMGGFHLSDLEDDELGAVISALRELGVERAAPCHCSGERARELFGQEYGDGYIANGVGMAIEV